MCRSKINYSARPLAAALAVVLIGSWLAACSQPDLYLDRRETVGQSSGDAIAANAVTQMVDPWPANAGNKNIAFNGQKMQSAIERYRTNRVIPPVDPTTSDVIVPPAAAATPVVSVTQNSNPGSSPGAAGTSMALPQ
jgi:hypothetical protein